MTERSPCTIIAGPCSIGPDSLPQIVDMARITIRDLHGEMQRAIAGARVVGLKSRTALSKDGLGMGIDYAVHQRNMKSLLAGGSISHMEIPPSAIMAGTIYERTGLTIATEVCDPMVQLPPLARVMGGGPVFIWGPSVQGLGHPYQIMGDFAQTHPRWTVGEKNLKWLGEHVETAEDLSYEGATSMEGTWRGLTIWTSLPPERMVMIHRGVDVAGKGDYRNQPIHQTAARVKTTTGIRMFFDPSHSLGPKMRNQIVDATIAAMQMHMPDGSPLYDGALVEAGDSQTDTGQHITLDELGIMCQEIAKTRTLVGPDLHPSLRAQRERQGERSEVKGYE